MAERSRIRLIVLEVLVLSLLVTLAGRLWYLQIREGTHYTDAAHANSLRAVVTPAVRGSILDDEGRPLVDNRTGLVVSVNMSELSQQSDGGKAVLKRLASVLHMTPAQINDKTRLCAAKVPQPCWNGSPYEPIPVATDVSTQTALQIAERQEQFPGVTADTEAILNYPRPYNVNAAQDLGYLTPVTQQQLEAQAKQEAEKKGLPVGEELQGTDQIGAAGLEAGFDSYLRGTTGETDLAVNSTGDIVSTVKSVAPEAGDDVISTLDARVQAVAEQQLVAGIMKARHTYDPLTHQNYKADSGSMVVMDVHTGRIIAMATYPTYDPSVWVGGISQSEFNKLNSAKANYPLISRAFQGEYAPGSTFKVVSSSAALQDGFSAAGPYDCSSNFTVGGHTFDNDESESAGEISLADALAISCDTVFYRIAYKMWQQDGGVHPVKHPKDPMQTMALDFGLGKPTGLDIPGELSGQIQTRQTNLADWEKNHDWWCYEAQHGKGLSSYIKAVYEDDCTTGNVWLPGDAINESIGQSGILVTPVQLARMYSAVANGGTLYEPQLARAIVSPSGKLVKNLPPVVQGHVPLKSSTVNFLRNALVGVTQHGTAAPAFAGWPLNQIPVATKTGTAEVQGKQTSSVFASFAPANNPQYAIVMVVSQGGWGYTTSGFSVKNVYQALMGVNGGSIDRAKAIFPSGAPPSGLPTIKSNGQIVVNNTAMIVPILPLRTGGGATGLPASEPPYPFRLRT